MSDLFPATLPLRKIERDALAEFKTAVAAGRPWGRRQIVSMQACEQAGYVRRVTRDGLIVDWELTEAGAAWTPPADI